MFESIRHALDHIRGVPPTPSQGTAKEAAPKDETDPIKQLEHELHMIVDRLQETSDGTCQAKDLRPFRQKLGHIDACYHEGRFDLQDVQGIPPGQAKAAELLAQAHELLRSKLEKTPPYKIEMPLRSYYDKLENLSHALDTLRDKPNLRPRDLRPYRMKLAEVDAKYHEARIAEGGTIPEGQAIVAKLLANNHEKIRDLLLKTDYYRVDPLLMPLHDRLESLVHMFESLKERGPNLDPRVLDKYRAQLDKIDASYVQGRFVVEGQAPEGGQAVLVELLEKAHALMQELQRMVAC